MIEVDRLVEAAGCRIVINNFQVFAERRSFRNLRDAGTRRRQFLPRNLIDELIDFAVARAEVRLGSMA